MLKSLMTATLATMLTTIVSAQTPQVPIFDMHSDVLYRMIEKPFDLVDAPNYISTSIPLMEQGGTSAQVFALWVHDKSNPGMEAAQKTFQMIDLFNEQAAKHSDRISLATTMAEAEAIRGQGKTPVFLFIEGGNPISDDIAMLRTYHRLGVRGMTLTWMNNLLWAGAATADEDEAMGLTEFGAEVVKEMNRLDMVVDLSHVSDKTFFDAIALSSDPVVLSHSGVRAICDHPRNASDEMLKTLAEKGGVIGIVAYPGYLSNDWDATWEEAEESVAKEVAALKVKYNDETGNPNYRYERKHLIQNAVPQEKRLDVNVIIDHIEHVINVAGEDHVGLGSDFDGVWSNVDDLETEGDWQNLVEGMKKRGFSDQVIAKVMHGNVERVFREVMDK